MKRLLLPTVLVAALAFPVVSQAAPTAPSANAQITNISAAAAQVGVSGTMFYLLCVQAPSAPTGGVVQVQQPGGNVIQTNLYSVGTCGGGGGLYYQMQGNFTGNQLSQSGTYVFQDACVLGAGWIAPCIRRDVGIFDNYGGQTIAASCQVDFVVSSGSSGGATNCQGGLGDVTGGGGIQPTPTPTAIPSATASPIPSATATAIPSATAVPSATATAIPSATASPVPSATVSPLPTTSSGATQSSASNTSGTSSTSSVASTSTAPSTSGNTSYVAPAPGSSTNTERVATSSQPVASTSTALPALVIGAPSVPTSTPVSQPTASSGKTTPTRGKAVHTMSTAPRLVVTLVPAAVRPGEAQRIAVSYAPRALIEAHVRIPGHSEWVLYDWTDGHGQLTFNLRIPATLALAPGGARATFTIVAFDGPLHRVLTLSPLLSLGTSTQLAVSAEANAALRALVTLPGQQPSTIYGHADSNGLWMLSVVAPSTLKLTAKGIHAAVAVDSLQTQHTATVTKVLRINAPARRATLAISLTATTIADCKQVQTVQISGQPHASLSLQLLFPHGVHFAMVVQTDGAGQATLRIPITYKNADAEVEVAARVTDMVLHRTQQARLRVALPTLCQKALTAGITVGG